MDPIRVGVRKERSLLRFACKNVSPYRVQEIRMLGTPLEVSSLSGEVAMEPFVLMRMRSLCDVIRASLVKEAHIGTIVGRKKSIKVSIFAGKGALSGSHGRVCLYVQPTSTHSGLMVDISGDGSQLARLKEFGFY